jgi:hypothetical protein
MADLAALLHEVAEQQAIATVPNVSESLSQLSELVKALDQQQTEQNQSMQRLLSQSIETDSQTPPIAESAEPQQLTLFPEQPYEPERKSPQQRRPPARRGAASKHRDSPEPDQQAPHPAPEKSAAAAQSPPLDPAASTGSRFAELAAAFGQLADQLDPSGRSPGPNRSSNRPNQPDSPESTSDLGELHHQLPPDQPAAPELGASTAEPDRTAAPPRSPDQQQSEPSQTADSLSGEMAQPDPSLAERTGTERQSSLDYPGRDQPQRQPAQFAADLQRTEQQIYPPAGADERADEQPRDPTEETAEANSLTETEVDPELAIAQAWSDADLLAISQRVQTYFQQPPPEPDWQAGERLSLACDELAQQTQSQAQILLQRQQELERLGVKQSWHHPFGSPAQIHDAATARSDLARSELATLKRQLNQTRQTFLDWQRPAKRYHEWRYSELGKQMHQAKAVLDLEPVQERLTQLHQEQQRQKGLKVLKEWEKVAICLDRSEPYLQRIQELMTAYRAGEPISERAKQALQQDMTAYLELQERQQQRQKEQQQGFCL